MAKQITIPLTTSDCILYYLVEYRVTGNPGYSFQQNYYTQPIVLQNLSDTTSYDVRVTPYCCDGTVGTPTETTFDTDVVPAPTSFNVAQVGVDAQGTWDDMSVDDYEWQRATNAAFTTSVTAVFQTGGVTTFTDLAPGAGTFWYRVRSVFNGVASDWSVDSVTLV